MKYTIETATQKMNALRDMFPENSSHADCERIEMRAACELSDMIDAHKAHLRKGASERANEVLDTANIQYDEIRDYLESTAL